MKADLQVMLENYEHMLAACDKADTHASYLSGKVDVLKDLIKLGFKEVA
jgi:hypothetical protein